MSKLVPLPRADAQTTILEAARDLFAARGLHDVTMAEVAEAAGVARATVFNHFGSKHALVDAISAEVLQGYVLLLDGALADRRTPTPVLVRTLFEWIGRGIEENARFYRAIFRELAKVSLGLDEGSAAQQKRRDALALLLQLHTRGQARGDLVRTRTAEALASAFDSLVFGTVTHWLYEDSDEPLHARMQAAAEVLLGGIAAQPEVEYDGPAPVLLSADAIENRPARRARAASRKTRRRT
jgi:AcrR family transcriptional regulator